MKKPPPGKKTIAREDAELESDTEEGPKTRNKANIDATKAKQASDFPYKDVQPLKPVVEVPPMPARYMREQKQPNYRHKTEIEEGVELTSILERILSGDVSLSYKELLALSPKLREAYKDQIAKKRVAVKTVLRTDLEEIVPMHNLVQVTTLAKPEKVAEQVLDPEGRPYLTWRITDPISQYLESVPREDRSRQLFAMEKTDLITAKDMATLRVIPTLVNDVREEEALLDSGSQIVSMSRTTAMNCKITWDPDVTINMQSANGQINRTCGLAKNVPFSFGDVTVYLQVHVVENPPYDILLGRPFDVLTESRVVNSSEGAQMIVITDPNTKARTTLPTYAKGQLPKARKGNF
jgi:hypothetical protein